MRSTVGYKRNPLISTPVKAKAATLPIALRLSIKLSFANGTKSINPTYSTVTSAIM